MAKNEKTGRQVGKNRLESGPNRQADPEGNPLSGGLCPHAASGSVERTGEGEALRGLPSKLNGLGSQ